MSKVLQNAPLGTFWNTYDLHYAIIGIENQLSVFLRVTVLHWFYCIGIVNEYFFISWYPNISTLFCMTSNLEILTCSDFFQAVILKKYVHICLEYVNQISWKSGTGNIFFFNFCKHMVLIHRNVKYTIIVFQCKTYLNWLQFELPY